VRAHEEAGADQVAIQTLGEDGGVPRRGWTTMADT
jgi:hypothetical protein